MGQDSVVTTPAAGRLLLLDTASLYFRAFFGMPDSLRAADGTPVNAVRGLLDFIARLVADYQPVALAACWDNDWRPQWRVDLIPSYKAHRVVEEVPAGPDVEETPDLLSVQVPLIAEALALLGITVVGAASYEADDIIGTLATGWDGPVEIVTGDRDLFQLVDDDRAIRVLYIARGVGRHERIDAAAVRERYGVQPAQYADFATLRGDASDGLPGVAGVGDKTAAALLAAYADLDGVRAAAQDRASAIKPGVKVRIREASDYLDVAPTVVRVATDIDLGSPDLAIGPVSDDFVTFAQRWNLGGSAVRVVDAIADLE